MKLFKKTIAILMLVLPIAAQADTPLVQALKIEQSMKDVITALHDVNADVQSFSQAPDAIRGLTRIGDLLDGVYDGPITIKATALPYAEYLLQEVPGRFDIYTPNLTSLRANSFSEAIAIDTFYAPVLTSIGGSAFYMGDGSSWKSPGIRNAVFPSCTSIGSSAFSGCHSLTNVILNASTISEFAFDACTSLKTCQTKPLTSVNKYAFRNCSQLKHIDIDQSSCSFGAYALYNCSNLKFNVPNNMSWDEYSFYGCKGLTNINNVIKNATAFSGSHSFQYASLQELYSENVINANGEYLFANNTSMTNICLPNLVNIGSNYARNIFDTLTSLETCYMPKLQTIGSYRTRNDYMMASWTKMASLDFPSLEIIGNTKAYYYNPAYTFSYGNFKEFNAPNLQYLYGDATFAYCQKLEKVYFPSLKGMQQCTDSVNPVDYSGHMCGFIGCTSLKEVVLPELEELYGTQALFHRCYVLKKVYMPKLRKITEKYNNSLNGMYRMFSYCPMLRDVTFGFTAQELLSISSFSNGNFKYPVGEAMNAVFHCPAEAPYNVDVMYIDGAWKAVTNGTFKLCESIKGTGAQYINTGYIHGTNTQVEVDFSLLASASPKQYEFIFGARNNSDTVNSFAALSRWNNAYKFDWMRNQNVQSGDIDISTETRYRMVCCTNRMEIYNTSGELLHSLQTTAQPNEGFGPLMVFTANNATTKGGLSANTYMNTCMKLYRFTIKEEGETIMDLVPGIVGTGSSETPCLLDAADNYHPLFNTGTGQFEAGSVTNSIPTAVGN